MKCFRLLFDHLAWIKHQFLRGIRDSRKAGSLLGMIRGFGGVRKSIHQSWLAKRLGLGLLCWGSSGRDSLGRGQHSSNRVSGISTRTMHQSTTPSLSQTIWPRWAPRQFVTLPIVQTLLPVTFGYSLSSVFRYETIEEMKEAVTKVNDTLTQEDFQGVFEKFLEQYNTCIAVGGGYFEGGLELYVCAINKSAHTKKVWKLI